MQKNSLIFIFIIALSATVGNSGELKVPLTRRLSYRTLANTEVLVYKLSADNLAKYKFPKKSPSEKFKVAPVIDFDTVSLKLKQDKAKLVCKVTKCGYMSEKLATTSAAFFTQGKVDTYFRSLLEIKSTASQASQRIGFQLTHHLEFIPNFKANSSNKPTKGNLTKIDSSVVIALTTDQDKVLDEGSTLSFFINAQTFGKDTYVSIAKFREVKVVDSGAINPYLNVPVSEVKVTKTLLKMSVKTARKYKLIDRESPVICASKFQRIVKKLSKIKSVNVQSLPENKRLETLRPLSNLKQKYDLEEVTLHYTRGDVKAEVAYEDSSFQSGLSNAGLVTSTLVSGKNVCLTFYCIEHDEHFPVGEYLGKNATLTLVKKGRKIGGTLEFMGTYPVSHVKVSSTMLTGRVLRKGKKLPFKLTQSKESFQLQLGKKKIMLYFGGNGQVTGLKLGQRYRLKNPTSANQSYIFYPNGKLLRFHGIDNKLFKNNYTWLFYKPKRILYSSPQLLKMAFKNDGSLVGDISEKSSLMGSVLTKRVKLIVGGQPLK